MNGYGLDGGVSRDLFVHHNPSESSYPLVQQRNRTPDPYNAYRTSFACSTNRRYSWLMEADVSEGYHAGGGGKPHEIHHVNPEHHDSAFTAMSLMRQRGQLCDVALEVGGVSLQAHKVVLAASSAYFDAMFNNEMAEKHKSKITLHDVDTAALQLLVQFAYTGEIVITEENVQTLLPVASLLQVTSVREACCKFLLRQLHPTNCLGIRSFADAHACEELQHRSHKYALQNFHEVAQTEEFLLLSLQEVEDLISSDNLNVRSEEYVFTSVMTWIKHDLLGRQQHLGKLMHHVRLPLMQRDFLLSRVSEEPLITSSEQSKDLLIEAMKFHLVPEQRSIMASVRTVHRKPDELKPYIIAVGGGSLFAIHKECEYYNPRTDRWASLAPTLHRRSRAGVAALNRFVYAVGGYDGSKDLWSAEYYEPNNNTWNAISNMGTRRSCLGISSLHGLLYVAGGYDGASCLSTVERYDPLVTTWCSVAAMEMRRRYCRLCVLDGALYAVGGYDGTNYQSTAERYDPREGKWRLLPSMLSRRSSSGVTTLDGMIYVIGGNDGSLCMSSAERFDPVRNAWEVIASMHSRRTTHEAVQVDGQLYAVGGNDGSSSLGTVERYDARLNKWMLVTSMLLRRSSLGTCVIDAPNLERLLAPKSDQS